MRGLIRVAFAFCLAGAVATFAAIFVLTEQTPEETTALSSAVEASLVSTPAVGEGDAASGSTGRAAGVAGALLSIADVRAWAHVPEFFLLGLFLFGAAALWPGAAPVGRRPPGARARYGVALLSCMGCSLFDQVHKAFVPGREFDARDLPFDALGYLLALALVLAASAVARSVGRRRARSMSPDG